MRGFLKNKIKIGNNIYTEGGWGIVFTWVLEKKYF